MSMQSPPASAPPPRTALPFGVLIVDDQEVVCLGIARLIASASMPMYCAGSASSSVEALLVNARLKPEVVVLDVDLNGEDGLALIPELSRQASVLVLTSHGDSTTRRRAAQLGAVRFVEKHEPAAELLRAIAEAGGLLAQRPNQTDSRAIPPR